MCIAGKARFHQAPGSFPPMQPSDQKSNLATNVKRRSLRNADRVTRVPSKSITCDVRVTSSSRFTPCTPSLMRSVSEKKIDPSSCPVASP